MKKIDPKTLKKYSSFKKFLVAAQNGELPKGTKFFIDGDEFSPSLDYVDKDGCDQVHVFVSTPVDEAMTVLMREVGARGKVEFV